MPLWSRRSVLATGSWLVLAMAPLATAAPPRELDLPETAVNPLQLRSAEERWQRLKNQYPVTGSVRQDRSAASISEPQRRIPDDEAAVELPTVSEDVAEVLPVVPANTPSQSSGRELPFPLLPSEPVWIVTTADPQEEEPISPRLAEPPEPERAVTPEPESTGRVALQVEAPPAATQSEVSVDSDATKPTEPTEFVPEIHVKTIDEIRVGGAFTDADLRTYSRTEADKYDLSFGDQPYEPRHFTPVAALFEAPDLFYYPLYFQDPLMERYGHTHPFLIQPAVSVARFGTQLVGLPYQMVIDPPHCLQSGLGWLDPGDYKPTLKYQIPWSPKAAAVEAGVVTGLIFLIP